MRNPVVLLTDKATGEMSLYKRYGARIPDFLEKFPLAEGWSIEGSMTDLLSKQTGLLYLYREAIVAGRKPSEVGLPPIEDAANTFVFTTRFIDPQGRALRTAGALAMLGHEKAYEQLESASNQRLMAACGVGGEIFNADEDQDFKKQGLNVAPIATSGADGGTMRTAAAEGANATSLTADVHDRPDPAEPVAPATRGQVERLAEGLGVQAPTMTTQSEAVAALNDLGTAKQRRRRDTDATT